MNSRVFPLIVIITLSACAAQEPACEDAVVAAEQIQQCQQLQRQIVKAKDKPIVRTELERRYQADCIDVRYYRDDQQSAICDNKKQINKAIADHKESKEVNNKK
ncbi:MAG: hypothetical protein ACSHW0_03620 [Thalassotalea sp.]